MQTTPVEITITQDDIDVGIKASCRDCPGARAIQRILGYGYYVNVFKRDMIFIPYSESGTAMLNPPELIKFIVMFDNSIHVEPTTFTLDIPSHLVRV